LYLHANLVCRRFRQRRFFYNFQYIRPAKFSPDTKSPDRRRIAICQSRAKLRLHIRRKISANIEKIALPAALRGLQNEM